MSKLSLILVALKSGDISYGEAEAQIQALDATDLVDDTAHRRNAPLVGSYAQGDTPISNTERYWVCFPELDDDDPHITVYSREKGGCPDHEIAGGCTIPTDSLNDLIATHTAEAVRAATEPYQRRLAQWLQPELMQMFVLEDMDRPMLLATCARYADWLLELDRLAQLKDPKGGE